MLEVQDPDGDWVGADELQLHKPGGAVRTFRWRTTLSGALGGQLMVSLKPFPMEPLPLPCAEPDEGVVHREMLTLRPGQREQVFSLDLGAVLRHVEADRRTSAALRPFLAGAPVYVRVVPQLAEGLACDPEQHGNPQTNALGIIPPALEGPPAVLPPVLPLGDHSYTPPYLGGIAEGHPMYWERSYKVIRPHTLPPVKCGSTSAASMWSALDPLGCLLIEYGLAPGSTVQPGLWFMFTIGSTSSGGLWSSFVSSLSNLARTIVAGGGLAVNWASTAWEDIQDAVAKVVVDVNRHVTWWPKITPFIDYLSRSSYLLQRGQFVGDVLYYYGDGGYKFVPPRTPQPGLGRGYDYDVTNSDVILNRLAVRDGRFVLPDGTSYAVLVLPDDGEADPAVLARIERLVADGGTIVPRPQRAHGLAGFPGSDRRVAEIAARLWADLDGHVKTSRAHGKGHVIWGQAPRDVLASMGIGPDVTAPDGIDFIHRRDSTTDIYFVRNTATTPASPTVTFRVTDREPELWDPVSGDIRPAPAWRRASDGRIELTLDFAGHGSMFVVFRRPGQDPPARTPQVRLPAPVAIDGPWTVDFEGGPTAVPFSRLISWTDHPDPAVRHFAGSARYRTRFTVPGSWREAGVEAHIDLGRLWTIGEASLNGQPLGITWTAPFTLDASAALRDGENELIVEITNTWHNRLVADARLPREERTTRTNVTASGGKPWADLEPLQSGLFGPVRLVGIRP